MIWQKTSVKTSHSSTRDKSLLTNIMARAVLRSLRYFSRYFSFWFFRGPLFILILWSEELVGDGKAGAEAPEPELEMVFCCGELRNDWAVKACRACCRSSSVCQERGEERKTEICSYALWGPEVKACAAFRMIDETADDKIPLMELTLKLLKRCKLLKQNVHKFLKKWIHTYIHFLN